MLDIFEPTIQWIRDDFNTNPLRFTIELFAWILSVGCSLTMAITVPNPPLYYLYPVWISGCSMYAWAAYSRKSSGMLANYFLLMTIDIIGFIKLSFT